MIFFNLLELAGSSWQHSDRLQYPEEMRYYLSSSRLPDWPSGPTRTIAGLRQGIIGAFFEANRGFVFAKKCRCENSSMHYSMSAATRRLSGTVGCWRLSPPPPLLAK